MINRKELAICKRRGHDRSATWRQYWGRCKLCGMWLREVVTVEEREDDPPEDELDPLDRVTRDLAALREGKAKKAQPAKKGKKA